MFPHRRSSVENVRQRVQRRPPDGSRPCAPAESRLEQFCPLAATEKQRAFLNLNCREAFYGGAAGGGKSTALLMGALAHAYVPGYSALILRRDTQRLHLAGGLIPKSHEWLSGTGAKWNAVRRQWTIPTKGPPATITFGYLQSPLDKYRYGSSEYQYIAFDELTEMEEEDYLFPFSRLRKTRDFSAPLRVRSASNPGGPGHLWVKSRFIGDDANCGSGESGASFSVEDRQYIPARVGDNPFLDGDEYRQSLVHLPPVTRERLLNGDWSIQAAGLIEPQWLRYFVVEGNELQVLDERGKVVDAVHERKCLRFCTIDPASTPAAAAAKGGRNKHSHAVIQVWYQPHGPLSRFLFLRHQWRKQARIVELLAAIRQIKKDWKPVAIYVEQERLGMAICDLLKEENIFLKPVPTEGKDKETRAQPLIVAYSQGRVLLPKHDLSWRMKFERELLTWTGDRRQPCDQIDAAAYAAIIAERQRPGEKVVLERLEL